MTPPQGHPNQAQRNAKLLCLYVLSIEYRIQHGIYIYSYTPGIQNLYKSDLLLLLCWAYWVLNDILIDSCE